jgi:hypothetical protein
MNPVKLAIDGESWLTNGTERSVGFNAGEDGASEHAAAGLKALTLIDRHVPMRLSLFLIP